MLQRIDHVAFTVSDMTRAVYFFVNVLGFTEMGRWTSETAKTREVKFLALGNTTVELILGPDGSAVKKASGPEPGFRHLCLRSDDLDIDLIQLAGAGAKFLTPTMRIDSTLYDEERAVPGYSLQKGLRRTLVEGPDGIVVEIMEREE